MVTYFNPTLIAEWMTFIIALFVLDKKTTFWRLFIILLFLILVVETAGWYMIVELKNYENGFPFNLLMLTNISFFIWFLSRPLGSEKIKSWLRIIMILFLLFGAINLIFFQGFKVYNSFSEAVGDIILALVCCYYLFFLLKAQNDIDLLKLDYFWLATGILFYSLGSAMLYQFSYPLSSYHKRSGINIGNYINYALNLVLYSTFIIAFICRRKTTR